MATILAIESSCDETSIAIIKDDELLANVVATQISMHQQFGGVMPELASRLHCENVLYVLDEAVRKANIKLEDIDAFAFTRGPGLVGALHIGMQVAKTLAMLYDKPLIPVHHLAAHIYANEYVKPLKGRHPYSQGILPVHYPSLPRVLRQHTPQNMGNQVHEQTH